jgi:membrane-associated phospholipid phosphatase
MSKSFLHRVCSLLAICFHPLLMPTFIYAVMVYFTTGIIGNLSDAQKLTFMMLIFVSTFIMPMMVVILLLLFDEKEFSWKSLFIENASDRVRPFLLVAIIYGFLSYYMLQTWSNNMAIAAMLAAIAVAIFLTAIISRYWKISAHAVGIGGLCGSCAMLNLYYLQPQLFMVLIVVILLAGIVLSSRVYLQAHTLPQVYAGWILGAGVCVSSIMLL